MNNYFKKTRTSPTSRFFSFFFVFIFLFTLITPPSPATTPMTGTQSILNLPLPGTLLPTSERFTPTLIKGITIYPKDPLKLDFIVNSGHENLVDAALKDEATHLIKYFLAALTIPEEDLWVNLSPYEKDRVIPEGLGDTLMGRDMLAQDYLLKQLTASLMYPENELGKKFWSKVYQKAFKQFGTTEIPLNTFNKVWIMPDEAIVYEHEQSAYVIGSRLKVMLEEDYLAMEHNTNEEESLVSPHHENSFNRAGTRSAPTENNLQTSIIREILIPEIEKEINEGQTFAQLRQIYHAMILATWYKQNLKESFLGQTYAEKSKTLGVDTQDKSVNHKIYNQYVESFTKGAYNYIKEDYDPSTEQTVPRKYFSGGLLWRMGSKLLTVSTATLMLLSPVQHDTAYANMMAAGDTTEITVELTPQTNKTSALFKETRRPNAPKHFFQEMEENMQQKNPYLKLRPAHVPLSPSEMLAFQLSETRPAHQPLTPEEQAAFRSFLEKSEKRDFTPNNDSQLPLWQPSIKESGHFPAGPEIEPGLLEEPIPAEIFTAIERLPKEAHQEAITSIGKFYMQLRLSSVRKPQAIKIVTQKIEKIITQLNKGSKKTVGTLINEAFRSSSPAIPTPTGGIDLNPDELNLKIKRDGNGIPLPVWEQPPTVINFKGLSPVILNMTPIPNLPQFIGLVPSLDSTAPATAADGQSSPLGKNQTVQGREEDV